MIVTGDIESLLYAKFKELGFKQFRKNAIKEGIVKDERVIISCGSLNSGKYWNQAFVNVNICVPDINGMANTKRLTEIERIFITKSKPYSGVFDETTYRCSIYSIGQEEDIELKCHYVNVRLIFEVLNV